MDFELPRKKPEQIIEMETMLNVVERTLAVHHGNGLVVWSGPSRVGKTTTARRLVAGLEAKAEAPDGFRAHHYEVGEIGRWSGNEQKKMIRSVHTAALGRIEEGRYNRDSAEEMAKLLVSGLEQRNLQMLFIDEAGCLSAGAIRGLTLICDTALNQQFSLTLVLIGMDDLPTKVKAVEQVYNRVHEWCYFEPYTLEDTWAFLRSIHRHFAALDVARGSDADQVGLVHERFGGLPGNMVPFLRRLDLWADIRKQPITLDLIRTVMLLTDTDEDRSIEDASTRSGRRHASPSNRNVVADAVSEEELGQSDKGKRKRKAGRARKSESEQSTGEPSAGAAQEPTPSPKRRGRPPKSSSGGTSPSSPHGDGALGEEALDADDDDLKGGLERAS